MKSLLVAIRNFHFNFFLPIAAFASMALCLMLPASASAQADPLRQAREYLSQNKASLGFTDTDIADLSLRNTYTDAHNGVTHLYVQQLYKGIEIKHAVLGLHYRSSGELLFAGNNFHKKLDTRLDKKSASILPEKAVELAAEALDLQIKTAPTVLNAGRTAAKETTLSNAGISLNDIPAKLVYAPAEDGSLRLAWEVQIYTLDAQNYWVAQVDARSGKLLGKQDLVIKCNFDHNAEGVESQDHHCEQPIANSQQPTANFFPQENENISSLFGENFVPIAIGSQQPTANCQLPTANSMFIGNLYRVFNAPVEAPSFGSRTLVNTTGDPIASPFGWHNDGYLPYSITKGNNVYAYEDKNGTNSGTSPNGGIPGQMLNFDYPVNLSQAPATYTSAAVTNLFFWNNYIHDVMYRYGFDEPSGNFQFNNLANGGLGGDAVMAEAQDGGGTNNANFLTLGDGAPGRMQMYLWSSSSPAQLVHIQSSETYPLGGVNFTAIQAAFGPALTTTGVTGQLVIVEANQNMQVTCPNDCGCGTNQGVGLPPNNNVQGKIVLIDRGTCSFIEKVMGAQLGGAAGVIIVNNAPGAGPVAMGGAAENGAPAIIIPSVMVSFEDGLELRDEIALGNVTVSLKRLTPAPPNKDGDFDNGIITHEYGHGVSSRLTGGAGATPGTLPCLSGDEQAGEGWSDFFAVMLTMNPATVGSIGASGRGVGSYVFDQPTNGDGIRPAKYSTDMSVNSYTYGDIDSSIISVPHGIGFIFCTALWEMTFKLIATYGYDPNIKSGDLSKGNILALQLVMDGLKLQPCSPTFLQSRDAILAADEALTNGVNQCLIWEAFAKRGMGFSAVSGTNARGDEIEAFDTPPTCLANVEISASAPAQVTKGEQMTYTLTVQNLGGVAASNIIVTDPIPAGTSYVSNSASNSGSVVGGVVTFPPFNLAAGQTTTRTFSVTVNPAGSGSTLQFSDDMEDGITAWTFSQGVDLWTLNDENSHGGDYAWFAGDPGNASNQTLDLATEVTLPANAQLRFWHLFSTEAGFDGGLVELSNDGGLTWINMGAQMTQNGYTDFVPAANNPLINGFAFGGSSNGWIETVVNLGAFSGQPVSIRFRFSSDFASPGLGWFVDDVVIGSNITFVHNTASFLAGSETGSSSVSTLVLAVGQALNVPGAGNEEAAEKQINHAQQSLSGNLQVTPFPNPAKEVVYLKLDGETSGDIQLQVLNVQGQPVQQQFIAADEVSPVLSLNAANLPTGMYWVNLRDDLNMRTVKVFIEK